MAMRAELETNGVLPKLVSKFNERVAEYRKKGSEKTYEAPRRSTPGASQSLGDSISSAWKEHQEQRKARGTKVSGNLISGSLRTSGEPSSTFFVREHPSSVRGPATESGNFAVPSSFTQPFDNVGNPGPYEEEELARNNRFHPSFADPRLQLRSPRSMGSGFNAMPQTQTFNYYVSWFPAISAECCLHSDSAWCVQPSFCSLLDSESCLAMGLVSCSGLSAKAAGVVPPWNEYAVVHNLSSFRSNDGS
ncbi:hypothetical protein FB446DRAFT_754354 [Lentinula raphanica]|nr:hypothetical protein FB446DRAFT_754354 [Lentinula raphanica]